jgi:hypothetical protein
MKTTKLRFYIKHVLKNFIPDVLFRLKLDQELSNHELYEKDYIESRVSYYLKQAKHFSLPSSSKTGDIFTLKGHKSAYFYDLKEHIRYFPSHLKFSYIFGDVTYIPKQASFVKSRPISDNNHNSVLLKLDSVRHFQFLNDPFSFEAKMDKAIFRGCCHQQHRRAFLDRCFGIANTDIGDTRKKAQDEPVYKSPIPIKDHLKYKFIISVEGNDVATNLKWIMNSNSLCFMTKPKFETWFMEGRLIPNYHYVLLKDDYSNLSEKMAYYSEHTQEAKEIVKHAKRFAQQFQNTKRERYISLLVIKRYLEQANYWKNPICTQSKASSKKHQITETEMA